MTQFRSQHCLVNCSKILPWTVIFPENLIAYRCDYKEVYLKTYLYFGLRNITVDCYFPRKPRSLSLWLRGSLLEDLPWLWAVLFCLVLKEVTPCKVFLSVTAVVILVGDFVVSTTPTSSWSWILEDFADFFLVTGSTCVVVPESWTAERAAIDGIALSAFRSQSVVVWLIF